MKETFPLQFNLQLQRTCLMTLQCNVDVHDGIYHVSHIRYFGYDNKELLPPVQVRKFRGHWVHEEFQQETDLSFSIGKAIDQLMLQSA